MDETKPRRRIGRPAIPDAERRVDLPVRVPRALRDEIDAALDAVSRESRSEFVEAAVRAELDRRRDQKR